MNDKTTIVRTARIEDPFARVLKSTLADPTLSWKAKGILSYLLGQPDNWTVRIMDLVNRSTDGKAAARAAVKELRDRGYAQLVAEREGNRIKGWKLKIADKPIFRKPEQQSLGVDSLDPDFLDLENRTHTKNNSLLRINDLSSLKRQPLKRSAKKSAKEIALLNRREKFLKLWNEAYQQQFGREYALTGFHEVNLVKAMLANIPDPAEKLIETVKCAWQSERGFWCTKLKSITVLTRHLNEIRDELAGGRKEVAGLQPGRFRTVEELDADFMSRRD